ncbi:MAG: helix-turn-helix transcriptional regulator [Bermanella sp.]
MQEPIFLFESVLSSFDVPEPVRLSCKKLVHSLGENSTYISNSETLFDFYNLLIPCIDDPDWCWRYGEKISVCDMDSAWLALITCKSVSELLYIYSTYSSFYTPVTASYEMIKDKHQLTFKAPGKFYGQSWFHVHVVTAYTISLLKEQFGVNAKDISVTVPLSKKSNLIANKLRDYCDQYDSSFFTISLSDKCVNNKNFKYNPIIYNRAIKECESKAVIYDGSENTSDKILALFKSSGDQILSLDEVAKQLNTSARNVRKKMLEENTSFKKLSNNYKFSRSCHFLKYSDLHIEDIGHKIGYSCPSNFRRAFIKNYGVSPSAYRQQFIDDSCEVL